MIKDLKDLQTFLKICRKQGVTQIKFGDTSVNFGELSGKTGQLEEQPEDIQTDELTPEQLMFYSAGGDAQ